MQLYSLPNLSNDTTDYNTVAEEMEKLAKQQPGFLGVKVQEVILDLE